ncbi:MAG: ribonuclease HII [Bacteroidales bacterium]|nr:ribonuclease HII [Bacteroidales bacterium]
MNLKQYYTEDLIEAGCDEAGRGCIAGPVVAAAVILPRDMDFPDFDDSKKLTEKQRENLRIKVMENAVAYGVGIVSAKEIDEINILNASFLAMHRAIDQLKTRPELLLIDGNRFNPYKGIRHQCIVGGDAKYQSIAAASILAKTTRDHIMEEYHKDFPQYNWLKNKGYPTPEHKNAVAEHGVSPIHRMTFNMAIQLKLF